MLGIVDVAGLAAPMAASGREEQFTKPLHCFISRTLSANQPIPPNNTRKNVTQRMPATV